MKKSGEDVKVDFHGHQDRGLGVINAITAALYGADRVHGTALGIGERVGNAPLDQILVNMKLLGLIDNDLSRLADYVRTVSEAVAHRPSEQGDRLRVAGAVVPGTVAETTKGVRFEITDGKKTIPIVHQGDTPGLFKDGAPVVCEGRWSRGAAFDSDRILIKHGNEYKPPKVDTTGPRS